MFRFVIKVLLLIVNFQILFLFILLTSISYYRHKLCLSQILAANIVIYLYQRTVRV